MGRKPLWAAALTLTAAAFLLGRPLQHLYFASRSDDEPAPEPPPGYLDDAGRYASTQIDSVIAVPDDSLAALLAVQSALRNAALTGRKISIGGARHSMGGQTLFPNALVLDMRQYRRLRLDTATGILTAAAGARWSDVLAYLDGYGRSIRVMQGNANFTVGGSVSVNCHGGQPDHAPIASTVEALRIVDAEGRETRCSRRENRELFSLAVGGYGLFGVILDVELRTVPNESYAAKRMAIPVGLYPRRYAETVAGDSDVGLAGARLNVAKDDRLNEAFLEYYLRVPGTPKPLAPADRRLGELRRAAYLGSARDEYGKGLRWSITKRLEPLLSPDTLSRNQVLMADAEVTANQSLGTVDVPQEYFIPAAKLGDFLNDLRGILANHPRPDLMDVLIRSVGRDKDAYLKYAREDAFAVMLTFRVVPVADGEEALTNLGRELIDKALELGGTYYLPYRQHATADQFKRAYPMALDFFALKRKYDPGEVFQNHFYSNYGRIEP